MDWWRKLFKPKIERMLTEGNGDGIILALIADKETIRTRAAKAVRQLGVEAFIGLSADGLVKACSETNCHVYIHRRLKNIHTS